MVGNLLMVCSVRSVLVLIWPMNSTSGQFCLYKKFPCTWSSCQWLFITYLTGFGVSFFSSLIIVWADDGHWQASTTTTSLSLIINNELPSMGFCKGSFQVKLYTPSASFLISYSFFVCCCAKAALPKTRQNSRQKETNLSIRGIDEIIFRQRCIKVNSFFM